MAVYKCKSCNANLNIEPGDSLITCEFCGATQIVENTYEGENYVKRGYMFLEEGEFLNAEEYFEKALDENSEAYDAYLGKVLANKKISTKEEFFTLDKIKDMDGFLSSLKYSLEYKNAIRFAPSEEKKKLTDYRDKVYQRAYDMAIVHKNNFQYEEAIALLKRVHDYKDAASLLAECEGLMNSSWLEKKYQTAVDYMDKSAFKNAINFFEELKDYKDSRTKIKECVYRNGKELMKTEDYVDAISCFEKIIGYENSKTLFNRCSEIVNERKYNYAKEMLENSGNIKLVEQAKDIFLEIGNYKDAVDRALDCDKEVVYIEATNHMKKFWSIGELSLGRKMFYAIKKYKDSHKLANKCNIYKVINILVTSFGVIGISAIIALYMFG